MLQESWACVEEAGYDPDDLSGTRCGVFIGCSVNGYGATADAAGLSAHQNLGTNSAILASRVSYTLNLKAPASPSTPRARRRSWPSREPATASVSVTATPSLAGGVWVIPGPGVHVAMSQLQALSPDGRLLRLRRARQRLSCRPRASASCSEAARGRAGGRRPDPRRHQGLGREPGRQVQRHHRPERGGAGPAPEARVRQVRHRPR
ncbi:hypothetical protein LV779_34525 [Streptomyces thinghirensis]|nr:hypothetical protein [Streptomyces thinghirensis]